MRARWWVPREIVVLESFQPLFWPAHRGDGGVSLRLHMLCRIVSDYSWFMICKLSLHIIAFSAFFALNLAAIAFCRGLSVQA